MERTPYNQQVKKERRRLRAEASGLLTLSVGSAAVGGVLLGDSMSLAEVTRYDEYGETPEIFFQPLATSLLLLNSIYTLDKFHQTVDRLRELRPKRRNS